MSDIGDFVKTVAPWLGAALTGNVPALASMAASTIGDVLGIDNKTVDAVKQAVGGATPEQMLAIKAADNDFSLKMQQLGFEHIEALDKIEADDRQSAREREMAVKDKMPAAIAAAVLVGFFGILSLMIFVDVSPATQNLLSAMLGSLGTLVTSIGAYYFGSSSDAARSSAVLSKIAQMP